jgi:hypothetical protein
MRARYGFIILGMAFAQALFPDAVFAQEPARPSKFNQADMTGGPAGAGAPVRTEILYGENSLVLASDRQEKVGGNSYRAAGNIVITFLDIVVTCEEAEYDGETRRVSTRGETRFRQARTSLISSGIEFDPGTQTITFHDVTGYFYDTSGRTDREFFLTGGLVQPVRADRLQINWGTMKIVKPQSVISRD